MKNNSIGIIGVFVFLVIFVVGWVMNIIALVGMINDPLTGMMVLRGVGIFVAPLGVILGYFF